jgi:mono/diheme cytochrome c family protein
MTLAMVAALYASDAGAAERSATANFILRCSGCHGMDGSGSNAGGIPDFRNYIGFFAVDDDGRTYVLRVPGVLNASLSDSEISAVMNYVMTTWGGTSLRPGFVAFTPEEVAARRSRPVADVVQLRRQIVQRLHAAGISTAEYPWP